MIKSNTGEDCTEGVLIHFFWVIKNDDLGESILL